MANRDGILLVGHGTRNEAGAAEFLTLAALLQRRYPAIPVAPCFLELREPTIAAGIEHLAAQGARTIAVVPLLLFAAGHARQDIPAAVAAALAGHPGMTATQAPPLDCHPRLVELSRLRFAEAAGTAETRTLLILVGRGSRDADATAAMQRFAELRQQQRDVAETRVGFLAMAEPRVGAVLEQAASEAWPRIVVQPHLLFQGELLTELNKMVQEFAARHPATRWLVTQHLAAGIGNGGMAEQLLLEATEAPRASPAEE